jgi:hypothetical protein
MKKKLTALFAAIICLTGFSFAKQPGPGEPTTMKIGFTKKFTSLDIKNDVNVVLTASDGNEILIKGEREDVKRVRATVSNGCLTVWMANGMSNKYVTVYVPAALLDQVIVNGDSNVQTETVLTNPRLDVEINGECSINIRSLGKVEVRNGTEFEFVRNR